ncbi:MAG: coproporphyrinogen III oxidase [Rhizomicrobium sp.]
MSVMHGRVFEKVGVNVSTVDGTLSADFAKTIPGAENDPRFWASSISLIAHMRSPHVPAVHMNTRHMITDRGAEFGGGADVTPMYPNEEDRTRFHAAMQRACDAFGPETTPNTRNGCDEYFYLPHRKEPRGRGGIFFDRHNSGDWEKDFAFTKDVGAGICAGLSPNRKEADGATLDRRRAPPSAGTPRPLCGVQPVVGPRHAFSA